MRGMGQAGAIMKAGVTVSTVVVAPVPAETGVAGQAGAVMSASADSARIGQVPVTSVVAARVEWAPKIDVQVHPTALAVGQVGGASMTGVAVLTPATGQ